MKFAAFLIFTLSLLGCGGHVIVGVDDVVAPQKAARLSNQIKTGISTRDDMNRLLCEPLVSSKSWKLELYRIDHKDSYGVYTWAVIPIPIFPTWFESADQIIYVLVAYDRYWKVRDYDTGYFVEGIYQERSAQLKDAKAGGFLFELDWSISDLEPAHEWLYAPYELTPTILGKQPRTGFCTIYITTSGVKSRLLIDNDIFLDERIAPGMGFLAIPIFPGRHEIKVIPSQISMGSLDYKGEPKTEVICQEGQRFFVAIRAEIIPRKSLMERNTLIAEFLVEDTPSTIFNERLLILYHNGKWVGPEKPD